MPGSTASSTRSSTPTSRRSSPPLFLFQFGTGPIRGFATTLTIGLLTNVFTSVFVSRALFELVLGRGRATRLSI